MKTCTRCEVEKVEGEFSTRGYTKKDNSQSLASWCKACHCKCSRDRRKENPENAKEISRRSYAKRDRFVVALESSKKAAKIGGYVPCNATSEELELSFTGRCEICGVPELECSKKLVMDHSHEDGFFRGWLCSKCNRALGFFNDNEELISSALLYLTSSKFR